MLLEALALQQSDDGAALAEWNGAGRDALVRAIMRAFPLRRQDAEEVVQELSIRAIRAIERGEAFLSPGGWVALATRRLCWRQIEIQRRAPPLFAGGDLSGLPCSDDPPERALDRADEMAALRRTVARTLPVPHAQALVLHHLDGWTEPRVAAYLHRWRGVGVARVHQILAEGRAMWRFVVEGGEPRSRWPRRFGAQKKWLNTIPPSLTDGQIYG